MVKSLGAANSTTPTQDQTAIALFFSGSAFLQTNRALENQVSVRNLDIVQAARMFAAVDMTVADALISVWHAKYLYGFWRPITAIQQAATMAIPRRRPTRPGNHCWRRRRIRTTSVVIQESCAASPKPWKPTLRTRHLQLTLTSTAVPGAQRSYDSARTLCGDVLQARIWLGIHLRTADTTAARMGQKVADYALDRNFEKVHGPWSRPLNRPLTLRRRPAEPRRRRRGRVRRAVAGGVGGWVSDINDDRGDGCGLQQPPGIRCRRSAVGGEKCGGHGFLLSSLPQFLKLKSGLRPKRTKRRCPRQAHPVRRAGPQESLVKGDDGVWRVAKVFYLKDEPC